MSIEADQESRSAVYYYCHPHKTQANPPLIHPSLNANSSNPGSSLHILNSNLFPHNPSQIISSGTLLLSLLYKISMTPSLAHILSLNSFNFSTFSILKHGWREGAGSLGTTELEEIWICWPLGVILNLVLSQSDSFLLKGRVLELRFS